MIAAVTESSFNVFEQRQRSGRGLDVVGIDHSLLTRFE